MSKDPDLERRLERLMSRVELPVRELWVPVATSRRRAPWSVITVGAAAAALLLALTIGVVGLTDVAAPGASRRPVQTLPTLLRPTPTPVDTATPSPRGTAILRPGPAPIVLPLGSDDVLGVQADDGAAAYVVRAPDNGAGLYVIDLRTTQRRPIATTSGRFIMLGSGAIRRDLVTYVEEESRGERPGGGSLVTWHVMVANWRTGAAPREIDTIAGEIEPAPHFESYAPRPRTNGNEVVWLHAPRVSGRLTDVQIRVAEASQGRDLLVGEASFSIDDRGRIAVSRSTDAANTSWDLLLYDANGPGNRIVMGRAQGGQPYLSGSKIVWERTPLGPRNVTSVDIVDIATGAIRTVTKADCAFRGATVQQVVYSCQGHSELVDVENGAETTIPVLDLRADPHAFIGRETRGANPAWTVTPIP